MESLQEEPLLQESIEEQQLAQESAQEERLPQESTLHDHEGIIATDDQSGDSMLSAKDPFCVDTGCKGKADRSNGSSTFLDMYSSLKQCYGSKWPTPSDTPILQGPENDWYGSNLPLQFDTLNFPIPGNLSFGVDPILRQMEPEGMKIRWFRKPKYAKVMMLLSPHLHHTIKLPPGRKLDPSSCFLNSFISLEKINPVVVPRPDKMKSGSVSEPQQTILDGIFAGEVVADQIEPNRLVDPFVITRKLTRSDVARNLYLTKDLFANHILPFLRKDQQALIKICGGVMIEFYNGESSEKYEMKLQKLPSHYELQKDWKRWLAVKNLQEGDTIDLYWDKDASHFCLSVVHRSNQS